MQINAYSSSVRVDLKSVMGSSLSGKTASTGIMTRTVKEISKMIPTTMEWTRTRASKKIFLQAFILITMLVSLSLFTSQTVVCRVIIVFLCKTVKVYFR